jgi:PhnB protein
MNHQPASGASSVQSIPADYGSLCPYVSVRNAAAFLDFLHEAFAAVERGRVVLEDGTIGHAEVWIGNRVVQMFDARPGWPDTPALLSLYVEDCDAVHAQALAAGATEITPLFTNAWGDRMGRVRDPFGNIWWIQTHVEDVDETEMIRRMSDAAYMEGTQRAQQALDDEMRRRGNSGASAH